MMRRTARAGSLWITFSAPRANAAMAWVSERVACFLCNLYATAAGGRDKRMGRMSEARVKERAAWLLELMGDRKAIARHEVIAAYRDTFRVPHVGNHSLTRIKKAAGLISWDYTRGEFAVRRSGGGRQITVWADPRVLMMSRAWRQEIVDALPDKPKRQYFGRGGVSSNMRTQSAG